MQSGYHTPKSKIVTLVTALFCIVFVSFCGYDTYKAMMGRLDSFMFRLWLNHSKYSNIQLGMTKDKIKALVGYPSQTLHNPLWESWKYAPHPDQPNETIYVDFDPYGKVTQVYPSKLAEKTWQDKTPRYGMAQESVERLIGKPNNTRQSRKIKTIWVYNLWNGARFILYFTPDERVYRFVVGKPTPNKAEGTFRTYLWLSEGICVVSGKTPTVCFRLLDKDGKILSEIECPFYVSDTTLAYYSPRDSSIAVLDANGSVSWVDIPSNLMGRRTIRSLFAVKKFLLVNLSDERGNPAGTLIYYRNQQNWHELKNSLESRCSYLEDDTKIAILTRKHELVILEPLKNTRVTKLSDISACWDWDYDFLSDTLYQLRRTDVMITHGNGTKNIWRIPDTLMGRTIAIKWNPEGKELWIVSDFAYPSVTVTVLSKNGQEIYSEINRIGTYRYFQYATPKLISNLYKSSLPKETFH